MIEFDDIREHIINYVEKSTKAIHSKNKKVSMMLNVNIDFIDGVGYDKQLRNWFDNLSNEINEYNSNYFMVNGIRMIDSHIMNNGKRLQIDVLFDDNRSERVKTMESDLRYSASKISHLLEDDDFNIQTIGKIKKKDMYELLLTLNNKIGGYIY